jgi:nicotinamidase-related amidase
MKLREQNTALLLIDLQKGFEEETYWGGNRNNRDAESKCAILLNTWREFKLPIFHIIHSSRNPNSRLHKSHPGFEIKDEVKPIQGEPVITKDVNSAFIGTDLKERLERQNIKKLVIVGMTTNHCISTTTRMAGNLDFEVLLISDATATFDRKGLDGKVFPADLIHQTALASLNEEFAEVISMEVLLKRI